MTWHVFLFDGTGNGLDDTYPTNIRRLRQLIDGSYYFEGPGNSDGDFLGALFGLGCREIRNRAIKNLAQVYTHGDKIAVFGFSRGAAIARMFCHKIELEVEFLGCFDTVFAKLPFGPLQQDTLFGDLNVSPGVKQARHAVALNEDRAAFAPNLMNARDGIKEVWFRGNHTDIGGGYEDHGLADTTLAWMTSEARQSAGLKIRDTAPRMLEGAHHQEDFPLRREIRRIGVKVNDEWSDIPALIYDRCRSD